ncbi:hypothetical protein ANO11243_007130 [Dothideomycetidae sp. 11243]|nr:hypothetical protein ANO11243_007130 [fungal sp. No.11243]
MDTRHPIQTSPDPVVLSLCFNQSRNRLVCGLDNGVRVFRANDCLRTLKEAPSPGRGYAIAAALDDRYIVLVGGGRQPNASPNKLQFWDGQQGQLIRELDFHETILGVRMTSQYVVVILDERTIYLQFHPAGQADLHAPGSVSAIHDTASNPHGLCCIQSDRTVLPGLTAGQVQIINLGDRTKKIIRAHASELRQMDLSSDGETLVTASRQGTLIRVFSISGLSQTHEFRRGVDAAIIYSLAISLNSHFVACTSDKGTIHIFDLRPRTMEEQSSSPRPPSQVFYTPPADIAHAPPSNAPSALSALAKLPGMPKAFSDPRSLASASYHQGTDSANWQGQPAFVMTTLPTDGRPPKGVLCWDPESNDRRLWCVGGGSDARWEVFDLVEGQEGRLKLVKRGYRKYLSRQFPEAAD